MHHPSIERSSNCRLYQFESPLSHDSLMALITTRPLLRSTVKLRGGDAQSPGMIGRNRLEYAPGKVLLNSYDS